MNKRLISSLLFAGLLCLGIKSFGQSNYQDYHQEVIKIEQLIAESKFEAAIINFNSLFNRFDFIFLRDCKLATELSAFKQDSKSGFRFLRLGIANGWTLKDIKKNDKHNYFQDAPQWENLQSDYDSLRGVYWSRLNIPLRQEAQEMLKNDQKIALQVFFRIGEKNRVRHAIKKFTPHSEKTLIRLNKILIEQGYPGEKLIGNGWWVSVNLIHHNSIYTEYTKKDTLYLNLRPMLKKAIEKGELHPYEFATIEDWRIAALNQHKLTSYGFLGTIPDHATLEKVNQNRASMGLRSTKLRNTLIDIEKETGMNLHLPKGWQKRKITVTSK